MSTIFVVLTVVQVLIALAIIAVVLLQRGKGAEAGAAFGAGASGTVFGAAGSANFLSRSTAVLATLFFANSLGLAYLSSQRTAPESLLERAEAPLEAGDDAALAPFDDDDLPPLPDEEDLVPPIGDVPADELPEIEPAGEAAEGDGTAD